MRLQDIAINNLRRRKSKVIFLLFGLVFGVATIVSLFSITSAMKSTMGKQFEGIGSKIIIKPKADKLSFAYGPIVIASGVTFDVKELNALIVDQIKNLEGTKVNIVAPKLLSTTNLNQMQTMIVGIDFKEELKLKRYWTFEGDIPKADKDILIGSKVANSKKLKVGSKINIEGQEFNISSILKETANEEDGLIFMNLEMAQQIFKKDNKLTFIEANVSGESEDKVDEVVKELKGKLLGAEVTAVKEAVEARKQLIDRFANFSLVISVIVLLIGTLIVMSTMMASVNERTREIGIFRAIGFRKSHIIKIILMEAGLVSLLGGIIGYISGMTIAVYLAPIVTKLSLVIKWSPIVFISTIILATIIGLLSGALPAIKASKLNPTEALRFI